MKVALGIFVVAALVLASPPAASQIVLHEERVWAGPPFPMGDYDSQTVPVVAGSYGGPVNPPGSCSILPAPGGPFGGPGPTLWHQEFNCCGAGAPALPIAAPFAAYNSGPPAFTYDTVDSTGASVANAGALSSYGIGGVPLRPTTTPGGLQQIVMCFDYVKVTEGLGGAA